MHTIIKYHVNNYRLLYYNVMCIGKINQDRIIAASIRVVTFNIISYYNTQNVLGTLSYNIIFVILLVMV